jgi:hypothetical protein
MHSTIERARAFPAHPEFGNSGQAENTPLFERLTVKEIALTQGKVAIVDDEDFESLNAFKWRASKERNTFYAIRNVRKQDGRWTTERMHRVIFSRKLGRPIIKGEIPDHENGDGLDNRRDRLRLATNAQNLRNRHQHGENTSSKYVGVSRCRRKKEWNAQIGVNYKHINLGYYTTELEAAIAREEYIQSHSELMAKSNFNDRKNKERTK